MPTRDRALHDAAVRAALSSVARDGLTETTLTVIADRLRLPGGERVSERTLRRRYGSVARLLFGSPWWLPEPADAVRAVLEPRPDRAEGPVWPIGPAAEATAAIVDDCRCENGRPELDERGRVRPGCCEGVRPDDQWPPPEFFTRAGIADPLGDIAHTSPEPIGLCDLVHDLHLVITGHLVATGWAARIAWVRTLRAEHPEVTAWLAASETMWADRLGTVLARHFGFDEAAGAVAAHGFLALMRHLEPMVGELAAPQADAALRAARVRAAGAFTAALSEPDRIRERRGRGTVFPGGAHGVLPHRLQHGARPYGMNR